MRSSYAHRLTRPNFDTCSSTSRSFVTELSAMQAHWCLLLVFIACEPAKPDAPAEFIQTKELDQNISDTLDQPVNANTAVEPSVEKTSKPTTPQLPRRDLRCPEGMLFVPGGSFTQKQIRQFELLKRKFGRPYSTSVDDFCMDQFEFTMGRAARCFVNGTCKQPAMIETFTRETRSEKQFIDRFLVDAGHPTWSPEVASLAAKAFRVDAKLADELCASHKAKLPTVEEWMWVYWGGDQHRPFPWGSSTKILEEAELLHRSDSGPYNPVDSFPNGIGRWGHAGLGTNGQELVRVPTYASSLFGPIEEPYSICIELDTHLPFRKRAHLFPCSIQEEELGAELSRSLKASKEDSEELRSIYSQFAPRTYPFRCVSPIPHK